MDRPRLDDPAEYRLIKSVYFKENRFFGEKLDPTEELERMESRLRNSNNNAR